MPESPTNAQLAEWLAREAEGAKHPIQRALRKAGRCAYRWREEAARVLLDKRPLTELEGVGPYLEKVLRQWIAKPPTLVVPDEIRQNFFTWTEAQAILASQPGW